jgi:hypothetical protein
MRPKAMRTLVIAVTIGVLLAGLGLLSSPADATVTVPSTPTPTDGADGRVTAITRIGDRVYIGGAFTSVGGQPHAGLAALDADSGRLVSTWRADVSGVVEALAPSSDGTTLYVGGDFSAVGGAGRQRLAAVSAATGAVSDWSPGAGGGAVLALAAAAGRVYAGGKFTSIGSTRRAHLAAVSSGGALDPAFDSGVDDPVWALALSPGGEILYAGGSFHAAGGQPRAHLAALSPSSGAASGWDPRVPCPVLGLGATSSAVYVAGGGGRVNGNAVLAYDAAGGARLWAAHTNGNVQAVAPLAGAVYAGGHFSTVNGVLRRKAAALDAASGQLLPWDPHPDSALGVWSLLGGGDSLWMGGDFTTLSGTSQPHVARFR